ncbi:MAG: hypothetical protein IJ629_02065 [Clostridia bacterium]|nr:hypothetical protein [Clostridia bacterium]
MRRVLKIALVFAILLFCNMTVARAATNEELIAYATKNFEFNGKTVTLKAADKVKVERYLNQYPVTDNQADQIIAKIDEGIAILRAANVTDPTKLSKEKKQEILAIGQQAAKIAGAELTYDAKNDAISIYRDGVLIDQATTSDALVQTGSKDYSYIVYIIAGVAVVAIAGFVVYTKKSKVNA